MCTLCGSKAMDYTTSFHTHAPEEWARDGIGFPPTPKGHSPRTTPSTWQAAIDWIFSQSSSRLLLLFFLAYSAKFVLMIDTSCACCPDYEDISMIITFWHAWTWPLVTYSCICLFLHISVYTQTTYLTIWLKRIDAFKQSNLINANEQVYFDISYLVGMKIRFPFLELIFLN